MLVMKCKLRTSETCKMLLSRTSMLAKMVNTNIKLLLQSPLFPSIFLKLTDSHIFILLLEELTVILSLSPSVHIVDHVLYHVSLS